MTAGGGEGARAGRLASYPFASLSGPATTLRRALGFLAAHEWLLSRTFLGLGALLAAFYWLQLTQTGGLPVDAHWYWSADPSNLYPHPERLQNNGYNYSPVFELVVGWGRLLPFEVFAAVWRALLLITLVWLAGPLTMLVLLLPPVASEINAGNIQLFLAAAIVVGFRWPAAWAFVLLTKATPGVGLVWFAVRREWRALAIAVGTTLALAVVTIGIWPDRWSGWLNLLSQASSPGTLDHLTLVPRLVAACGIIAAAAWRGWRWPVVIGSTLALPVLYTISPSLLVGVLPFLREAWRRRLARGVQSPGEETT